MNTHHNDSSYRTTEECIEAGLVHLATIDEADSYEVDVNSVFYNPATRVFLLRSASGCSCWDGEYGEVEFPTLDAVEKVLLGEGVDLYNPTLKGAEQLMQEARTKFAAEYNQR